MRQQSGSALTCAISYQQTFINLFYVSEFIHHLRTKISNRIAGMAYVYLFPENAKVLVGHNIMSLQQQVTTEKTSLASDIWPDSYAIICHRYSLVFFTHKHRIMLYALKHAFVCLVQCV